MAPTIFSWIKLETTEISCPQNIYFQAMAFLAKSPGMAITFRMATGIRIKMLIHMVGSVATERTPPKGASMVVNPPRPSSKRNEGRIKIADKIAKYGAILTIISFACWGSAGAFLAKYSLSVPSTFSIVFSLNCYFRLVKRFV